MHVEVASGAGFCFGVSRAISAVEGLLAEGKLVCTLGPIIHNAYMVEKLAQKGVRVVDCPEDVRPEKDEVLVIRSHGVARDVIEKIKKLNIMYLDATCPFVKKIHNIVSDTSRNADVILIAGDKNHPEVVGIAGHCNADFYTFSDYEELLDIIKKNGEVLARTNVLVVAQTTFSVSQWRRCVDFLRSEFEGIKIFNTICGATASRQNEACKLSKKVDVMLVIGGRESSNTAKLFDICQKNCKSFFIETADDLQFDDIKKAKLIGITAGASTPVDIIEEVKRKMEDFLENNDDVGQSEGEEANFEQMLEESLKSLTTDDKVVGTVVGIAPNEVYVDVGRKQAGFIPADELSNDLNVKPEDVVKIGDELNLLIMRTNDQDGTIMLSKKRIDALEGFKDIIEAKENGTVLSGKVTNVINGGIIVVTNGIKVFVPASLATASRGESLEDLKGKEVKLRIIDVNERRRRAVGSIRSVLMDAKKADIESFFDTLEVGKTLRGKVKSFTNYGAFIDLGPIDGMVHVSELSWDRVKHPSDVLNLGDEVEVWVKSFDKDAGKISLTYKDNGENPWETLKNDYPVGSVVDAKIVGLTDYGAFANFLPGIDGLIHVSQISNRRVDKPRDVLSIGDVVKAAIIDIDFDRHRISLSIKALLEDKDDEVGSDEEGMNPAEDVPSEADNYANTEEAVASGEAKFEKTEDTDTSADE